MGFQLLDIDKFIKENKVQQVTSPNTFDIKAGIFTENPDGLYSKDIFGRNIRDKREKFGYIDLKKLIFHPFIYKNLKKLSSIFLHVANENKKATISDGELVESEQGQTGFDYLIKIWDKIDFEKYRKPTNSEFVDFLIYTKSNLIKISKMPVIPILYRPFNINNGRVEEDEITEQYKKILIDIHQSYGTVPGSNGNEEEDLSNIMTVLNNTSTGQIGSRSVKLQEKLVKLYDYFIAKLDKKDGFFRSAFIGKRIDNVTRLVANARPDVPVDCVGVPWHVLLNVFDVYVLKIINKDDSYKEKLGIKEMSVNDFGKHIYYIYKNCDTYCKTYPDRQDIWIEVLEKVFNQNPFLRVMMKRDPAWSASSYWCLKPIIIKGCQYHTVVNSFYYKPLGGDSFNFDYMIIPDDTNELEINDMKIKFKKLYKVQTLDKIYKNKN